MPIRSVRPFQGSEKLKDIEELLKSRILSLRRETNYSETIRSYFVDFDRLYLQKNQVSVSQQYGFVLKHIKTLWTESEKNPSIFTSYKEFEPILQKNRQYRDHLIHSFNVFLLGYYIVNRLYEISESDVPPGQASYFEGNRWDINLTWMLAATFHDIAYPIERIESWLNDIFREFLGINPRFSLNLPQILPTIYSDFMRMLSCEHKAPRHATINADWVNMDWDFYDRISGKVFRKDHGVLGALMLCHRMAIKEGFLGRRRGRERTEGRDVWGFLGTHIPACHAIALHTLNPLRIKFTKHPIAFILTLCDELQDWGRPSIEKKCDLIRLRNLRVIDSNPPKIIITMSASEKRKEKLLETRRRLKDDSVRLILRFEQ